MKIFGKEIKGRKTNVAFIIVFAVLLIYALSLMIPFFWAILTSFKSRVDYLKSPLGWPTKFLWKNYATAIKNFFVEYDDYTLYIDTMIINSVIYAVGCSFALTAGNCITAYCCAKFSDFKISSVYTTIVIVAMALPLVGTQASTLQMLINLGIYDSLFGFILCQINFLGLYYLVFLAAFQAIPKDYSEAAYIDGANNFTLFFKLMVPFVSKTFLTVMLIQFIVYWNDYQLPLLYLPSYPTLSYGLYVYSGSWRTEISSVPMKMAGCMVLFLPIFIVFCVFQRQLLGNIMMGGIKE